MIIIRTWKYPEEIAEDGSDGVPVSDPRVGRRRRIQCVKRAESIEVPPDAPPSRPFTIRFRDGREEVCYGHRVEPTPPGSLSVVWDAVVAQVTTAVVPVADVAGIYDGLMPDAPLAAVGA